MTRFCYIQCQWIIILNEKWSNPLPNNEVANIFYDTKEMLYLVSNKSHEVHYPLRNQIYHLQKMKLTQDYIDFYAWSYLYANDNYKSTFAA